MLKFTHFLVWLALLVIYSAAAVALPFARLGGILFARLRRRQAPDPDQPFTILVLGTFYSRNWCLAHLAPLAAASSVGEVVAVVDGTTEPIEGVRYVQPPPCMVRILGRAMTKMLCACREVWRHPPDLVMGYHLLPSGITTLLLGRLCRAPSAYQLTGGPVELIGGGAGTENLLLSRLGRHSRLLEWLALFLARRFDLLIVRGANARRYLLQNRVRGRVLIVPGSIRPERFAPDGEPRDLDIVAVGRLVSIKQFDHVLRALAELRRRVPRFRAAVLGQGPLRGELESLATDLGLVEHVSFPGHVDDVQDYLRRARVFLLTSRSEGLSIAMAEAMAAGVVPVVADIGELATLVKDGRTGWLVQPGDFGAYADRIAAVISDPGLFERLSEAARAAAVEYNCLEAVAARWGRVFAAVCGRDPSAAREAAVGVPPVQLAATDRPPADGAPVT